MLLGGGHRTDRQHQHQGHGRQHEPALTPIATGPAEASTSAAGMRKMAIIWIKLVRAVGFSKGCAELAFATPIGAQHLDGLLGGDRPHGQGLLLPSRVVRSR